MKYYFYDIPVKVVNEYYDDLLDMTFCEIVNLENYDEDSKIVPKCLVKGVAI